MKKEAYLLFFTFAGLFSAGCGNQTGYKRTSDGLIVKVQSENGNQSVKLQVITDDIIHVIASPSDTFSSRQSLMVLPGLKTEGNWDIKHDENEVSIITGSLRASVSLQTGEVIFKDTAGRTLLRELKGGGKYFTEAPGEQEKSYAIRQVFESPADEAFYGLGGHQNGQMNYKGEDIELVQHNIVDVVPFLYSNKNYGILWDNYSISKFGDPRAYEPLNTLSLTSKDERENGLTAHYYVENEIVKTAVEDKIEYEFLETPQVDNFPKDVAQKGKVVWEGTISSQIEGRHKFLVYASGYFKVWVDDNLILDKWRQGWNPWTNKFTLDLKAGRPHAFKVEWIPDGGAYLAVKHLDPLSPEDQSRLSLYSEVADEISYYFVKGDNADEVIAGYRHLTGKAPVVPRWAMGFWQSRERYRSQAELLEVVSEYRKRKIPLDNIVLDWQYWKDPEWGSHEFDSSRFPDPEGMIRALHDRFNARLMISVWPKFNKGTAHYDVMRKNGFLFMNNIKKKRKDWVGPGYESTFYDPFNEEAGKLFWEQIDTRLNRLGVDAWWLDATEPDMHSNLSLKERKNNMSPTALGSAARYFNAYSLMNSKSVYEGQRISTPEKRVFILTRSSYAGQQRYGTATWSGDIVSRWSDLRDQIAAGINFSLSGIPYWTMDIGGFSVEKRYENAKGETLDEWRELNTRWFQFGAFCPVFRSHGQYPFREIYNIAPEGHKAYNAMVYYTNLRYQLMPYLYSLAGQVYFDDYTVMRGLVMDFNGDPEVFAIADQYMFGPALLVNPVSEYKARTRELYLPKQNGWYDLYTGRFYEGGQKLNAEAPYEKMPVYVKEGSIIPTGPPIQYSAEKTGAPITLYVYTGKDAAFTLYEDENVNYNYEAGKYTMIPFSYDEAHKTLSIGDRQGQFSSMPEKRIFKIIRVTENKPVPLDKATRSDQEVVYEGKRLTVKW